MGSNSQQLRFDPPVLYSAIPPSPDFSLTPPDPAGSLAEGLNASAGSPAPSGAGGAGGAGGAMMAGAAAFQATMAVFQLISTIWSYHEQQRQMDFQERVAKRTYEHQDKMGQISRDTAKENFKAMGRQQQAIADGTEKLNRARENRKEAEDGLIIEKARSAEARKTEKTWKTDTSILDRYFMGNPSA